MSRTRISHYLSSKVRGLTLCGEYTKRVWVTEDEAEVSCVRCKRLLEERIPFNATAWNVTRWPEFPVLVS